MRRGVLVVACVVGMLCVAPMGGAAAVIGDPLMDFNGDGFADLAVGVPGEDANGGAGDTGGVSVIYGSAGGLSATATPDQFWTQDNPNVEGAAEVNDDFGSALAAGDFNADGFTDLAIGVPGEDASATSDGGVNVIYGSAGGLSATATADQFWGQDSPGVEGTAENYDEFGSALATGDFNLDGFADLAVGVPFEDASAASDGGVNVIYGSASGLSATVLADQFWTQDSPNVEGTSETNDYFGLALAAGNFDGDGRSDLAVGVPYEDAAVGATNDGGVSVIYGAAGGLSATATPDQFWTQDSPNIEDTAEDNDEFGRALAVGDFGGSNIADLAIGVPYEDLGASGNPGAVSVIYGSPGGLSATATPDQFWTQDSPNVEGTAEPGDQFGFSLAVANFGGSWPHADLAIGVPYDNVGATSAGAVSVIYGSSAGLSATATPDQLWTQDSPDVEGTAGAYDGFGSALTTGDFNADFRSDLAIGVPSEDAPHTSDGGVNVIYGSLAALSATTTPDQLWGQDTPNVEDAAEASDYFGRELAAGS